MAAVPVFNLDQAVDNALARVIYSIRLSVELHEHHLAKRCLAMRTAARNRHLLMLRDLRGIAFPPSYRFPKEPS